MDEFVYLDHNATTPLSPAAREAMLPFLGDEFGNPSSLHRPGNRAAKAVARARASVAELLGAKASEIVFCSCGTESDALAVLGVLEASGDRRHVVTTSVEHPAVRDLLLHLEKSGRIERTVVPVSREGLLDADQVLAAVRDDTALVSVMWANNESGIVHPVEAIAAGCRERGVLFHTDAVQAAGKLPIDMGAVPVDLLTLSAHKFHGPKGVGVLFLRSGIRWKPFPGNGHQERERRGGTENVAGIVGTGVAAEEARAHAADTTTLAALRDRFQELVLAGIDGARISSAPEPRTPNTCHLLIPRVEGEAVLLQLDARGVAVSSGSACTAGSLEPSHVLTAMKVEERLARSALRVSFSHTNTMDEVESAAETLVDVVRELRAVMPV
ncbi:MAG: cysteine desulfurase family protein [Planctomycetota bacterium]|jgi:cysteine desulfurase